MRLTIKYQKEAYTSTFAIEVDDILCYYAYSRTRNWMRCIDMVSANPAAQPMDVEIKRHLVAFFPKYTINIPGQPVWIAEPVGWISLNYHLSTGKDVYGFSLKKIWKTAITKNGAEVGRLERIFNILKSTDYTTEYRLELNDQESLSAMLTIAMIWINLRTFLR
jgi:hypothetical protein